MHRDDENCRWEEEREGGGGGVEEGVGDGGWGVGREVASSRQLVNTSKTPHTHLIDTSPDCRNIDSRVLPSLFTYHRASITHKLSATITLFHNANNPRTRNVDNTSLSDRDHHFLQASGSKQRVLGRPSAKRRRNFT